jgi:hypothetical protein
VAIDSASLTRRCYAKLTVKIVVNTQDAHAPALRCTTIFTAG